MEKSVLRRVIDELVFDEIDAEILTSLLEELEKGLDPESPQEMPNRLLMEYDESGHGEILMRSDRDDEVDLPDIDGEVDLPGIDESEPESPGTDGASDELSNDRRETDDDPLGGLRPIDEAVSIDADIDVGHHDGWADAEIDVDVNAVVSDLLAGEDTEEDAEDCSG